MFEFENNTGGMKELDFFDNIRFVWVFESNNITGGIWELDFFDNILFVWMFELESIIGDIGDNCQHFDLYQFGLFSIFPLNCFQPQVSKT